MAPGLQAGDKGDEMENRQDPGPEPRPKGRLLIVEDEPDLRDSLSEFLADQGYAVDCAAHGRDALDRLRSDPRPNLILLDLMLPVMDGWEFMQQQSQDPVFRTIPVVVLSGAGALESRTAPVRVVASFIKPFDLEALLPFVELYGRTA